MIYELKKFVYIYNSYIYIFDKNEAEVRNSPNLHQISLFRSFILTIEINAS